MSKHRLGKTDNPTAERGERAPEGLQRIEVITGVGRRRPVVWYGGIVLTTQIAAQKPAATVIAAVTTTKLPV
jgi:hypothetical protein